MLSRRALLGSLAAVVAAPRPASAAAARDQRSAVAARASVPGRREELRALQRFAERTHPRGAQARADSDWQARWRRLIARADTLDDGAFVVQTRAALAWFRDGHTTLLPFEFTGVPAPLAHGPFGRVLPLELRAFDDGLYVSAARGPALPLRGRRVLAVDGHPARELLRAVASGWPGNEAWTQRWAGAVLASPALLHGLGFAAPNAAGVDLQLGDGEDATDAVRLATEPASDVTLEPLVRPQREHERWAVEAGSGNYLRVLDDGVVYVSIDDMYDVPGRRFAQLTREVFATLAQPPTRRLIIDLRRNGGGDNFLGEGLRRGIARSALNRPGGLYVLIGPRTFSAAQNLANRLERETFARFVGTPTGGAPNHYGDGKPCVGAATGTMALVSSVAWFDSYPDDARPWIMPDLPVADTGADWRQGRDPALDAARSETIDAPADELADDRVHWYRRASQSQRWSSFWRD